MRERTTRTYQPTLADRIGQFVDRCVFAFAPQAALNRLSARHMYQHAQMRTFEGAEATETRGSSWLASRLSADSALEEDLDTLRSRSREIYRNDPLGGSVETRCNLVVSYGFTPQARIKARDGISEAQAAVYNEQLESVFTQQYARIDRTGRRSLWQLLRLVERHHGCDGESFTILSDIGAADKPIPLALEVIDPERVQTPPGKIGNPRVRLGIEYDTNGVVVAYWIRKTHPGDTVDVSEQFERVDAARVLHVFEPWFAGQSRGLPWLTRTLNRVKDTKDFDEATIIAAQVEACFAAFVKTALPPGESAAAAAAAASDGRRYEDIRPGSIRYLSHADEMYFSQPQRPGNTFQPFMEWQHRRMAAGMNFPYEMVAKNWGGLSFAAGRLSLADAKLFVKSQQKLLVEAWLSKVWHRMVDEAVIVGACDIPVKLFAAKPWVFYMHTWTPPAWPYALTPGEEIDATIKKVDNNLMSKADAVGEYGGDWEDVAAQRKAERELERTYDIQPPSAEVELKTEADKAMAESGQAELKQEAAV